MLKLLRKGSSKDLYVADSLPDRLTFRFSDRVSVFDVGSIPVAFTGLGVLRCAIAGRLFEVLEYAGVSTHYFSHNIPTATMQVLAARIPEKDFNPAGAHGRLLPLEFLFRYVVTKKFYDRIMAGDVNQAKVERLLPPAQELAVGARLMPAFVECSTKWQAADAYISDDAAAELAQIEPRRMVALQKDAAITSEILRNFFRSAGFGLADGKFELILPFRIGDSISPDELRLIGPDGKSYDKDPVRIWYEENQSDWVRRLKAAKAAYPNDKSKWPIYEDVPPPEVVNEMVRRYRTVAEAIKAL